VSGQAFPEYPGPGLTRDDVVSYLLDCKERGWCQEVYEEPDSKNKLVMRLAVHKDIFIRPYAASTWDVLHWSGQFARVGYASTLEQLEQHVKAAARLYGVNWPEKQTSARLQAGTPATNIGKISGLIGGAEIREVFDPYLDNAGLTTLLDILSFGGTLANNIRLLSSPKMTQGANPKLTKSLVTAWFNERGITAGEVRLFAGKEHRRFMLLSGGQTLILGMSLNSTDKNEAIRLEPDKEDRPFFDDEWAKAAPLT